MTDFDTLFSGRRVMAILRGYSATRSVELAERAWDLGISAVEVPAQTPDALRALEAVASAARDRGTSVGAGTVITEQQVRTVHAVGAAFTVAPGFDPVVAEASAALGMPHLPGVADATQLQRAIGLGLDWVKVFPAAALGEQWFRLMRGPFPSIKLVATGGMSAENAQRYLAAGADVVAVGSALSDERQLPMLSSLMSGDATDAEGTNA
jgi:2-dehydro-3-deoxyphosphogluconate aldolase / (4S)-4-hydroxy-2-oxoglutarate aldolase